MNFYRIPTGPENIDDKSIEKGHDIGVFPDAFRLYPNQAAYQAQTGYPASDKNRTNQYFADRVAAWTGYQISSGDYLRFARNENGQIKRFSVRPVSAGLAGAPAPAGVVNMYEVMGLSVQLFYQEYGNQIGEIPQLEWASKAPHVIGTPNFGGFGWEDVPLGIRIADPTAPGGLRITWPQLYALRFSPDGAVEYFNINDYAREIPKSTSVAVPANFKIDDVTLGAQVLTFTAVVKDPKVVGPAVRKMATELA